MKFTAENHHFETPEKAREFIECFLKQAELEKKPVSILANDECWLIED